MKTKKQVVISTLLVFLLVAVVVAVHAQKSASVQMVQPGADIEGGKPLALVVKLDKPLPIDSSILARVGPESGQQTIQLGSAAPDDPSRKQFTLKTTMPPNVVAGKWSLQLLSITVPGAIDWKQLDHNPVTFEVQGPPLELPSKAQVTVDH
jgi:hypothetical protein